MDDTVVDNMRARVALCRRLASMSHNLEMIQILTAMADQGEADIRKLEEEAVQRDEE